MKKVLFTFLIACFAFTVQAQDMTLEEVLAAHYEVMGQEKLKDVQTVVYEGKMNQGIEIPLKLMVKRPGKFRMEGTVQGQTINQTLVKTADYKLSSQTSMMGMVLADQRYADGKAQVKQQGQNVPLPEEAVAAMKDDAALFPEATYLEMLDSVTVEGSELIDGEQAIVLAITKNGNTVREYYAADDMLKVQTVKSQGPQTVTQRYADYAPAGEILFPRTITLEGMLPVPLEMKVTEVEVNTEIDPALFEMD